MRRPNLGLLVVAIWMVQTVAAMAEVPAPSMVKTGVDAERLSLALRYVNATEQPRRAEDLSVLFAFNVNRARVGSGKEKKLLELLHRVFDPVTEKLTMRSSEIYAKQYSTEDLAEAVAFYESDPGRHFADILFPYRLPALFRLALNSEQPPDVAKLDPAKLRIAQEISDRFRNRLDTEQFRGFLSGSAEGALEDLSRRLAAQLSLADLSAANSWLSSSASERLEGLSEERKEALVGVQREVAQDIDPQEVSNLVDQLRN